MRLRFWLLVSLLTLSTQLVASDEEGTTGLTLEVAVSGFFSPEVDWAKVKEVNPESPAAQQGIAVGDQLVAIHDCKIPGCSAGEAKTMMRRSPGDTVTLTFEKPDGSRFTREVTLIPREGD